MSALAGEFPDGTQYVTIGAAEVAWTFGDPEAEYAAIRSAAAKMDLSGAGLVEVTGDDAYDLLQQALARDLEFVTPEQSLSSLLLDEEGHALDAVVAYHSDGGYRLETSVGNGPATAAHLNRLRDGLGLDAAIELVNDRLTVLLVEGPQAAVALEAIDPDLGALPLSGLLEVEYEGIEAVVSRSGFTGEYGYKIFCSTDDAVTLWRALDLVPAGAGALEAAMFEVRQPILHREDTSSTALENGYAWLIDITKESFTGRDAVLASFEAGGRSRVIGYRCAGAPERGEGVQIGGTQVGTVVHTVWSPGRTEYIGLVRMRPDLVAPHLELATTGGDLQLRTIPAPYYLPASWRQR